MTVPRLEEVLRETGVPDLVEILAERLSPPELETVLREAHHQRAGRVLPAALLAAYERDARFLPAPAEAALSAIDRIALEAAAPWFEPLDLSPICPIGTVAGLSPIDPGAALWVAGIGELVSDSTAVLALEGARRRRVADEATVRLCASHREAYVPFSAPLRSDPHTRVFALCMAGADADGFHFEAAGLSEQVGVHLRLLEHLRRDGYDVGSVTVTFTCHPASRVRDACRADVAAALAQTFPDVRFHVDEAPARSFAPVGFTIIAEDSAEVEHLVALGGCTDWTRQLLGRDEERLVVSRMATERVAEVFAPPPLGGPAQARARVERLGNE